MSVYTPYQTKYLAWELSKKYNAADEDKLTGVLSEAKVDLNPHQVDAALFAFNSPLSMGAILADEVGLGKTIEAALVISQHWAERKRRILIICPASLRKQWSIELEEKFYLPSIIMEKKLFDKILNDTYQNPLDNPQNIMICSYPFARKHIDHISRVDWDLVVIDEAHALRNVYKTGNKTAAALKMGLRRHKKLLLTATPLQNDLKELYGLISIIDDNYFGSLKAFSSQYGRVALRNEDTYQELRNRILPIVHRTLRSQVQAYVKYTNRKPLVQEYYPSDAENELAEKINNYLSRDDSFGMRKNKLITLVFYKLLASSTYAIAGTLETTINRLERMVENNEQRLDVAAADDGIACDYESYEDYKEEFDDEENEEGEDNRDEKTPLTENDLIKIRQEIKELREIHELALNIASNSKGSCLLQALNLGFIEMEKMKAPRKALIFTESRRTQDFLCDLLNANGYEGKIVLFNGTNSDAKSRKIYEQWLEKYQGTSRVTGSPTADKRQALVEYFKDSAEIMIATESAAEGINLQFCSLIVNYDLPWNPQRVEQRIGRCHRYGQKYDVVVVNFINKSNRADQRVYELLDEKFNLFKGVFGASDEVLGAIGNGIDFEKRILEIYRSCRNEADIDQQFNALQDELRQDIEDRVDQARISLFENFDEEVIEKLRMRENRDCSLLDRFNLRLWKLTCAVLGDRIQVVENTPHEFHLIDSPEKSIPCGIYSVDKINSARYTYRISHPLAQWVLNEAKRSSTPVAKVEFDYGNPDVTAFILQQNVGNGGYLTFKVMRYASLNEEEEHILLLATDRFGNKMDDGFAARLLSLPARIIDSDNSDYPENLTELMAQKQDELVDQLEIRDGALINSEAQKLENWVDDQVSLLKQSLNEIDEAIECKNRELRQARRPREITAILREQEELNDRRGEAWREFEKRRLELNKQRNDMLNKIYQLANSNLELVDEYTIEWCLR